MYKRVKVYLIKKINGKNTNEFSGKIGGWVDTVRFCVQYLPPAVNVVAVVWRIVEGAMWWGDVGRELW